MRYWIGNEGQLCNDEIQNIIDVTILEDLNTGDLEVWKGLGVHSEYYYVDGNGHGRCYETSYTAFF